MIKESRYSSGVVLMQLVCDECNTEITRAAGRCLTETRSKLESAKHLDHNRQHRCANCSGNWKIEYDNYVLRRHEEQF